MTRDQEKMLLDLSLEFSAAKENLAAAESFGRYLARRFQPSSAKQRVLEGDAPEIGRIKRNDFFYREGGKSFVLLALSVPLLFELDSPQGPEISPEEREIVGRIVRFFSERMQVIVDLKGLTYTDDLTGLYNQRYLEVILDRELSLAKRNGTEFSVLFLDLDHFKMVNDNHGHLIGSRLLYEVGEEIKRALRESDITFRYGGDEFVIILSHTGLDSAVFVAERIRVQIEKKRFLARDNMDIRLTASIGVATVPLHAGTKTQILKAADEALYGVKKAVRNSVIAATSKSKD
ncbi:MAG: GGDEF domain-containing protein [Bdellovibrionota bacterium]